MKRKTLTLTAAIAAVAITAAALATPGIAHGPGGFPAAQGQYFGGMMGGMGHGHGGGGGYGPGGGMRGYGPGAGMMGYGPGGGMMGYGPGAGAMGWGPGASGDCPLGQAAQGKDLTIEGVTAHLERRLAVMGNDRLKVGQVTEQGEDAIVGEIVTKDGSLVERLSFDRHTGRVVRAK